MARKTDEHSNNGYRDEAWCGEDAEDEGRGEVRQLVVLHGGDQAGQLGGQQAVDQEEGETHKVGNRNNHLPKPHPSLHTTGVSKKYQEPWGVPTIFKGVYDIYSAYVY